MASQSGTPIRTSSAQQALRLAVIIGILGVVVTGSVFTWLWIDADRQARDQLDTQLESVIESSETELDIVANRLISVSGLFRASVLVTAQEFKTFTDDIGLTTGLSGLGYIARVSSEDVETFEGLLQSRHGGSVELFELGEEGETRPLQPRSQHYILQYATPEETWGELVGYDVASDARVVPTFESAMATGEVTVSPFIQLTDSDRDKDLTVMMLAVSHPSNEGADALVGALMSFRDLISAGVPAGVAPHVTIDYAEGKTELGDHLVSGHLFYGDRQWTLGIGAAPGSPFAPDRSGAYVALVMGLVASALGSYLVILLQQRLEAATALAAAEQTTEAKDRFIAAVSHELRTPLTAVLGFAEILKTSDNLTGDERVAMMKAITEEAADLAHLIDDLLVAARGEIGQLAIADDSVSLRQEVTNVAAASGIGARLKVIPGVGAAIARGDPIRVRQILRNLVENARRYGGNRIEIELYEDDTRVTLEVRDNGAGIPVDAGERVFHPYERFGETPGVTESLGLGLTVSAQLATMMGGTLRHARRNDWTVFTLTLPADHTGHREDSTLPAASSGLSRP